MEEQFNREAQEGWIFAADAARITGEKACSEDRKHTSGGVFVAVVGNLGAVVREEDGKLASTLGDEGRITQVWVDVQGDMRVFSVYFLALTRLDPEERVPAGGPFEASQGY